jgi:two-component sensor histidine kinase
MQPINERTLWAAQISLAILLLAMIAAWIVGNISIRRPIDRLLRTAGLWQRGDFSARAALPKDRSELSKLGLAFDEMAAAVESRERNIGLLVRELEHRGGNLLGIVQAMAATTLRGNNIEQAREAFTSRLLALARSNRMFNASKGEAIDLMEVARSELSLFPDRMSIRGGSVLLTPALAQKYTLALHELVTNATKYGALTTSTGTIDVSWSVKRAARGSILKLNWQERGGPPVQAPSSEGFGTRLIKSSFPDAKLTFACDGLICELQVDLA